MSVDMYLEDDNGNVVTVENHEDGGTYQLGGTTDAWLNITYNYGWFYVKCLHEDGLHWLDGKRAGDCIEAMTKAVDELGTHKWEDYWAPTPGNAGYALNILLGWARQYPDAIFRGSW